MYVWLTTSQWSVSYQTQVENKYFRNMLMVRKNRTYSIFSMTSVEAPPQGFHLKKNSKQLLLPKACDVHLSVRLHIFCSWFAAVSPGCFSRGLLGGSWQRVLSRKYTASWNLKPFRGPVIKVSVLDVLFKWIFHVFQRSPRHFFIVAVCLSVCVCMCVWNGPHCQ